MIKSLSLSNGCLCLIVGVLFFISCKPKDSSPPSNPTATNTPAKKPTIAIQQPRTLKELLEIPPESLGQVDLGLMNLLCAEGLRGAETLDPQAELATLESWARHVATETQRNYPRYQRNPKEYGSSLATYRMMMLATVLQQDFNAHYSPDRARPQMEGKQESNDTFFGDARDVFIHGLLSGEHAGTCSSLPVLYAAIAQRLGYPVTLASAKGHFYVRYEEGGKHLNVEATSAGYVTHPDSYYRQWPFPITDADEIIYGLLRPMSNQQVLGAFLTIRANTLTSMKRFDEAADTWSMAAKLLPNTPALSQIVERTKARAQLEKAATRWDEIWEETTRVRIPPKPEHAHFKDQVIRFRQFMSQSTNLVAMEKTWTELKEELNEVWAKESTGSDATRLILEGVSRPELALRPVLPKALLAVEEHRPRRVQIPAERIPREYWNAIPMELHNRLRGLSHPEHIIAEILVFDGEVSFERNKQNQRAAEALSALPPPVPATWLPESYRERVPISLYNRLVHSRDQAQATQTIKQYEKEQELQRLSEARIKQQTRNPELTGPPVQLEIVLPRRTKP